MKTNKFCIQGKLNASETEVSDSAQESRIPDIKKP